MPTDRIFITFPIKQIVYVFFLHGSLANVFVESKSLSYTCKWLSSAFDNIQWFWPLWFRCVM